MKAPNVRWMNEKEMVKFEERLQKFKEKGAKDFKEKPNAKAPVTPCQTNECL